MTATVFKQIVWIGKWINYSPSFRCIELDFPLLAEYDFKNDAVNKDIK